MLLAVFRAVLPPKNDPMQSSVPLKLVVSVGWTTAKPNSDWIPSTQIGYNTMATQSWLCSSNPVHFKIRTDPVPTNK